MYGAMLLLHSWLRWAVVILLFVAIYQSFTGWFQQREWTPANKKTNLFLLISSHLQLLIGLVLYFGVSPMGVRLFNGGMKTVMKNRGLRFWAVEHITLMIIGLVLVQVGYSLSKRKEESVAKFKSAAIWFTAGAVAIFLAIPWPFMSSAVARPWFRLGFGG